MHLKSFTAFLLFFAFSHSHNAQNFSEKQSPLASYIQKKYQSAPFEGVKIIESDEGAYLVSLAIVNVASHKTQSTMNRVATIKARRGAMVYLQGSTTTSESILTTSEKVSSNSVSYYENYMDKISENASGFIDGMTTLTTFKTNKGRDYVYVAYKLLN